MIKIEEIRKLAAEAKEKAAKDADLQYKMADAKAKNQLVHDIEKLILSYAKKGSTQIIVEEDRLGQGRQYLEFVKEKFAGFTIKNDEHDGIIISWE